MFCLRFSPCFTAAARPGLPISTCGVGAGDVLEMFYSRSTRQTVWPSSACKHVWTECKYTHIRCQRGLYVFNLLSKTRVCQHRGEKRQSARLSQWLQTPTDWTSTILPLLQPSFNMCVAKMKTRYFTPGEYLDHRVPIHVMLANHMSRMRKNAPHERTKLEGAE